MENIELLKIINLFFKEKNNILSNSKIERKKLIPNLNLIESCVGSYNEVYNTKLLAEMLKINFIIDDGIEINFAKDFSNYIIKDQLKHNDINTSNDINIDTEIMTKKGRRIDLLIHNSDFEIIVENKINANELENQLEDYYNDRLNYINKDKLFIIFLTKDAHKPFSLDENLRSELEKYSRICYLSHNSIADFIERNILNRYDSLKKDKYISIYSALIQMRDNEKNISNNKLEVNNMEKNIIDTFFKENNIYESLNNIYDIEECSNLFLDAAYLIKSRKIQLSPIKNQIGIISKTIEYLKNKDLQNKDCIYLDEAIFKGNIINNRDANSLPINININNNIYIKLFINMNCCYVAVFSNIDEIIVKLNTPEIKEEIKKIFGNYKLEEGKNNTEEKDDDCYVYYFLIGENDNYEEIGNIIINLYNYLKEQHF